MEIGNWILYPPLVVSSAFLTYITSRDIVSPVAALLTAYYASIGDVGLALISAFTVLANSITRLLLARQAGSRRVLAMKIKYTWVTVSLVLSSIPIAYITYGASYSILSVEHWPLTALILISLYLLIATAVAPGLASLYSVKAWRTLRLDIVEERLRIVGVLIGAVVMLANSILHGLLGLLLTFLYVVTVVMSRRFSPQVSSILVSVVLVGAALVTYIAGYT